MFEASCPRCICRSARRLRAELLAEWSETCTSLGSGSSGVASASWLSAIPTTARRVQVSGFEELSKMIRPSPTKYWRIAPPNEIASAEAVTCGGRRLPLTAVQAIKPKQGVLLAEWEPSTLLGKVKALGVVRTVRADGSDAEIDWKEVEISLRPNPAGRRWWSQTKPFFAFAKDVAVRYMLDDLFADAFPEFTELTFGPGPRSSTPEVRPSASPTGGYVYVIRSPHGFKIGKTVNIRQRTRLFEVKLPFKNSVEHYAWFEDYTQAERMFHRRFHEKRLEGEWFDLTQADIDAIKAEGQAVNLARL